MPHFVTFNLVLLCSQKYPLRCFQSTKGLTRLSRMEFLLSSIGPVHFRFKGCCVVCFIFNRMLCKQTVKTLIRRRVLRRLIWVGTVCLCPTKKTLGLYGLSVYTICVCPSYIKIHGLNVLGFKVIENYYSLLAPCYILVVQERSYIKCICKTHTHTHTHVPKFS